MIRIVGMSSIANHILGLHGWIAAAVVFVVPALEASAFVGFVFPGEIAVLLGGVLASQHRLSLPLVLAAAVAGAVIGDTIGYEIGKRYGRRLLDGTVGRVVRRHHLDRAERYLAERGGKAVFVGRFTAALRVLIPGLAGMSGMRYRTFILYNALGGTLWAGGFVVAGYVAGDSWHEVAKVAGRASLVLLLMLVVVGGIVLAVRWTFRNRARLDAFRRRQLERPRVVAVRERFRRQLAFAGRRLRPGQERGLSLTLGLVVLIAFLWIFGALTRDVAASHDLAQLDRPVLEFFIRHREPWLTNVFKVLTTLGSAGFLIPMSIVVGAAVWWARRTAKPMAFLAVTFAGAELAFRVVKHLLDRARPSDALAVAHFGGAAFPSGHATLAAAMWGAIAITVTPFLTTVNRRVMVWSVAVVIAVLVGVTRLYLGAHWLTDVLAGWALGAGWLTATVLAFRPGRATA